MKRWLGLLVCLFLAVVATVPPSSAADAPAVVVGRVYAIEGDLLRYVPDENPVYTFYTQRGVLIEDNNSRVESS